MDLKKLGTTDVSHVLFGVKNHATVSIFFFFLSFQMHVQVWVAGGREIGRGRNSNLGAKFTVPTWRLGRLFFFFITWGSWVAVAG